MKPKVAIAAVVILLGAAGVWYWQKQAQAPSDSPQAAGEPAGLGAQIFEQTQNPTKNTFPEANPFAVDANPFDANVNPYKDTYKNPF